MFMYCIVVVFFVTVFELLNKSRSEMYSTDSVQTDLCVFFITELFMALSIQSIKGDLLKQILMMLKSNSYLNLMNQL